ncbi:predicted protein [Sclerotinia sclerotiorum 1980 UF-70]|uniref:Uncharacterized protein n=1 Tax=Sclerotinia sclerotiorum (strain ATCC 18683 / 1980 / Ss-1) TaxID=665079 RepID=A7EHJ9_SCLS1|nr:predicted protein [Sclerotinia sclerotiorum 1980 UF-70]EDO02315.1 predicted protein [Sclerotinia sclerotiorum 1980 UF-70]
MAVAGKAMSQQDFGIYTLYINCKMLQLHGDTRDKVFYVEDDAFTNNLTKPETHLASLPRKQENGAGGGRGRLGAQPAQALSMNVMRINARDEAL